MNWSTKAWASINEIYVQILDLPFLKELINGSLNQETFKFYLKQDSLYLAEFGKVLAGIACKLEKAEYRESFLNFAKDTVAVEQALHRSYVNNLESVVEASPSCLLYTCFIHKQLATAPIEEAVAAILPCFWIYKQVGDYILAHQFSQENPYQNWINTYGSEEFNQAVHCAINICNELAGQATPVVQNKMIDSFVLASKMEWMFWDSAYKREEWSVNSKLEYNEEVQ